jgi:hypothetical protein
MVRVPTHQKWHRKNQWKQWIEERKSVVLPRNRCLWLPESEYQFERRVFCSNPEQLRSLAAWLLEQEAEEAVMESTA